MAGSTPQDQRRVEQAPIPGVRLGAAPTAATFGASVAQVGEGIGLALYSRAVREANQAAFLSADKTLSEKQTEIQVQLSNLKGKDALRAPDALQTAWDKAVDEIDAGLANDQQKQAFRRSAMARHDQLNRAMQLHVNEQMNQFADGETAAYVRSSVDNVRLNAMDEEAIALEKSRQAAALTEQAQRKGLLGSEAHKEQVATVLSKTNLEVVKGRMLKGNDRAAKAFYDEHHEEFVAADRDVVERMLDEGSTRGEAQRQARALIAKYPNDFGEAVKEAEQIDDPKIQQFARELIKQHFGDLEIQKKRDLDDNYLAITNVIDRRVKQAPGVPFIARDVIPPDKWMWLTLGEKSAVQAYIDHATKPADRPNDDETWLTFLELPTEKKAALSKREYDSQFRQHLSQAFQTRADGLWEAARGALDRKEQKDPELTSTVTPLQQITQTFRTSGLVNADREVGKFTNDEMKMFVRFEQQATAAIEQEELAKKRKLTPTERQLVIDQVKDQAIKQVWVPGTWFDSKKPVLGLEEDEKGRAFVPFDKIPAAHLETMKKYMLSNGKPITMDKLRRAYGQFIQGNRAGFEQIANE